MKQTSSLTALCLLALASDPHPGADAAAVRHRRRGQRRVLPGPGLRERCRRGTEPPTPSATGTTCRVGAARRPGHDSGPSATPTSGSRTRPPRTPSARPSTASATPARAPAPSRRTATGPLAQPGRAAGPPRTWARATGPPTAPTTAGRGTSTTRSRRGRPHRRAAPPPCRSRPRSGCSRPGFLSWPLCAAAPRRDAPDRRVH